MKQFNKSIILIVFSFFITKANSYAQYTSGVSTPDKSQKLITDEGLVNVKYANKLKGENIKKHLDILASDAYEGRETGEEGNKKAAQYISKFFDSLDFPKIGDDKSYYQKVAFTTTKWNNTEMFIDGIRHKHLWDYLSFPSSNAHIPFIGTTEVIYAGYGIESKNYNDYKGLKVKDKVIMIYDGEPMNSDSVSWVTGSPGISEWSAAKKLKLAKEKGAKLVLIIANDLKTMLNENRRFLIGPRLSIGDSRTAEIPYANHAYISPATAQKIWGKKQKEIIKSRDESKKKGKVKSVKIDRNFAIRMEKYIDVLEGENVMGYIEGTDLKDELIVVSAHYDHIGMRNTDVYNGADDNASGTSTVLEIAKTLMEAKKNGEGPRRSILCLLVTGEEKGLLGSQYYSENPVFPLENHVANVNIDMIGRTDKKYADNPNYIYVIGSDRLSTDLHNINEEVNQKYSQITLDYTYNDENDPTRYYFRSDHYNFARKGIPAIFYFSGVHEDYHMIGDTADKIMFDKVQKVGRQIFHTTWELANRDKRIVVDGEIK